MPVKDLPAPCWRHLGPALLLAMAVTATGTAAKPADDLEDALRRYNNDDAKGAIVQLKSVLSADPKMPAAHALLGRALVKSGEFKAAEAAFEQALNLGAPRAEVTLDLGRLRLMMGEARRVLDLIPESLENTAASAEPLVLRASAQAQLGDFNDAQRLVKKATQAAPDASAPWMLDSQLKLRQGDVPGARAAALRATELAPKDANTWVGLARVDQHAQDNRAALSSLDRALTLSPKHAEARVMRLGLRIATKQDTAAQEDLQLLKASGLKDPRLAYFRGLMASRQRNTAEASAAFQEATAQATALPKTVVAADDQLLMAGALAARALGNRAQAREFLNTMLTFNARHAQAQLLMAELMVEAREFHSAKPILLSLREAMPQNPRVMSLLGRTELAMRNQAPAHDLLEKAFKLDGLPSTQRQWANAQFEAGKEGQAVKNLEAAFAGRPPDPMAGIQLAVYHLRKNQGPKALALAEAVLRLDPKNLEFQNFLGNVKGRLGDMAGARKAWEQALAQDPTFRHVLINLSWLDMEEGHLDAARRRLAEHIKRQPDDPDVLYQMGMLERRDKHLTEAEQLWTRANYIQRRDMRPGLALIDLALAQGQADKALTVAKSLRSAFDGQRPPLMALARVQMLKGDGPAAKATLIEATRVPDSDADAQITIGRLLLSLGDAKSASYNVGKALKLKPDHLEALVLAVEIEARAGDAASLDGALKTLMSKHPKASSALLAHGHVMLARGNAKAAMADYQAAMQAAPNTPTAGLLARAMVAAGQGSQAVATLAAWAQQRPEDRQAWLNLAGLQAATGQVDASRASFKKLLTLDPDNPDVRYHLAQVLARNGRADEARAEFKTALAAAGPAWAQRPDVARLKTELGI